MRWREDLKVQMGVLMFRSSDAYCRARLWITLKTRSRILKSIQLFNWKPLEVLKDRYIVTNGRISGDHATN